jgi:hypothetical protein
MQMNEEMLDEMCTFLQIDKEMARRHDSVVLVRGMARSLMVYQLYGTYWILRTE